MVMVLMMMMTITMVASVGHVGAGNEIRFDVLAIQMLIIAELK